MDANNDQIINESNGCNQMDEIEIAKICQLKQLEQLRIDNLKDNEQDSYSTVQIKSDDQHSIKQDQLLDLKSADSDLIHSETIDSKQLSQPNPYTILELNREPVCLTKYSLNDKSNFFKGCKWSPDGSCLLTSSNDKTIRLFNLPSNFSSLPIDFESKFHLNVDLQIKECGLIYDYCFNPNLNSADSSTCLYVNILDLIYLKLIIFKLFSNV